MTVCSLHRVVRHPSYTGLLLVVIGFGRLWGNLAGLAALTLLTVAGLVHRIRVKETALVGVLGDAYRSYAAAHKRLIPCLW